MYGTMLYLHLSLLEHCAKIIPQYLQFTVGDSTRVSTMDSLSVLKSEGNKKFRLSPLLFVYCLYMF